MLRYTRDKCRVEGPGGSYPVTSWDVFMQRHFLKSRFGFRHNLKVENFKSFVMKMSLKSHSIFPFLSIVFLSLVFPHAGRHGLMARGGHGLPQVSPGPTMPDPSTPYRRATPKTAGVAQPQDRRPAAVFYPYVHPNPCAYAGKKLFAFSFPSFVQAEPRRCFLNCFLLFFRWLLQKASKRSKGSGITRESE
jgi:hypothetical protein